MKKLLLSALSLVACLATVNAQQTALSEDFESGLPGTWTQSYASGSDGWNGGTATSLSSQYYTYGEHGNFVGTNDDDCNCDKSADSLFTPAVDLSGYTGTVRLSVDIFHAAGTYQGATESLTIIASDDGGATWSTISNDAGSAAWRDETFFDLSSYGGSSSVMVGFVYNDGGGWLFGAGIDNVKIFEPASDDLSNISIDNSQYHTVNTANDIVGTVMNVGTQTVTEFEISYTVDGGTAVTGTISGVSIAPLASYSYTHPTAWTPTSEMTSTVVTEIVSVNTNTDGDASNNEASMDILVHPTPVPRKPLLEQFTSSTCPPCQPGNVVVNGVLANYSGEYSKLNYQMSWPGTGDPYYTDEGGDRQAFYGVTGVPDMRTDGDEGINSNSFSAAYFEAAQDVPAFVNLTVTATIQQEAEYEVQNGALVKVDSVYHVTANVKMNPIVDMPAGLTSHITIQENITYDNVKTNGETEFHDVMKKMLPDASGTTLAAVAANDSFSFSESHSFVGAYRLSNDAGDPVDHTIEHSVEEWNDLRVVTWIQDDVTNEVWQSENAEVEMLEETSNVTVEVVDGVTVTTVGGTEYETLGDGNLVPLGVEGIAGANFSMFPNPANDVITITGLVGNAKVSIYDATGRLVRTESGNAGTLNVSDLEAGVYNIAVENKGAVKMEKVTIVH